MTTTSQSPTPSYVMAKAGTGQVNYVFFGGSINIPIDDGTYFTERLSTHHSTGALVVAFYDASGSTVTPTGGTISHRASPIEGQWLSSSSGSNPINASDCGAEAAYEIPVYNGPAIMGRITLEGVDGASYCRAYFWRE